MPVPWPLAPASFNGVGFHVAATSKHHGRRIVTFEYPKNDIPDTEDMGRRIRRFSVTGYILYSPVLDPDWQAHREELEAALAGDEIGTLVLPTYPAITNFVRVDRYSITEWTEKGGYSEFQMEFVEAGQSPFSSPALNTVATVLSTVSSAVLAFQNSSDITSIASSIGDFADF